MESILFFAGGLSDIFTDPIMLLYIAIGVLLGTIVGLIPGLGPSTAIALLLPLAMTLDPSRALVMMIALYLGAEYGGRISAIVLNMPGDASAMMTALDGYPLAKAGQAGKALKLSAIGSFVGSVIATVGLILLAAPLASLALGFGPSAYFAVVVMALVLAATLVGGNMVKSILAVTLGLMIATVGIDSQAGSPRFTFGTSALLDGVELIVVIIGLFGVGEIIYQVSNAPRGRKLVDASSGRVTRSDLRKTFPTMVKSSIIGFLGGVLPGSGTTLAAFLGYSLEKRMAKDSSKFGKGDIRGLVAPETASNASVSGAMVPTLSLGIPGSGTTAVLLAYLMMYGLDPGPGFFSSQGDLAWIIIAALAVSATLGLVLNYPLAPFFASILKLPRQYLYAVIILLALVSGFAINGSIIDVVMIVIFGALGYLLKFAGIPSALIVLGLVLGEILERTMRQAFLLANGYLATMLLQPLTIIFLSIAVITVVFEVAAGRRLRRKMVVGDTTDDREEAQGAVK